MARYKSIMPMIEAKYNSLTQSERSIADFFIKNPDEEDLSAKAMAQRLFVSEASLSRFAKKCGFNGYREFIFQYRESKPLRGSETSDISNTIFNTYQELLDKTYSLLDEAQISRIVRYMYETQRIVACGKGSSGLVASEMESRFMRIGVDIDSIQDSDRMRMQAVFLDRKNMVFGFSISGETEPVLYLLREAHMRGARTVLFTSIDNGKFVSFCDEVVLVASMKYLNYGNVISPQFPPLVMLDIVYNEYVNQDRYKKSALHDDTLRALKSVGQREGLV